MKKIGLYKTAESGQILVLVVILLVALIGIVGLAVDGGLLLAARRSAQNAADNAALAGAYAICTEAAVVPAAQAVASQNGFSDSDPKVIVTVNFPPLSGLNIGDDEYIEVIINAQHTPGLIQVLYSGAFEVTARAVAKCKQTSPAPLGDGNGLIVLHPSDARALDGSGNPTLIVIGGVYVNSSSSSALRLTGNAVVSASDGIAIVGNYSTWGPGATAPAPVTGAPAMIDPLLTLADPARPAGECIDSTGGKRTINPGVYCQISVTGGGTLTMNPGLYYIEGGDFSVSGNSSVTGTDVLIYSTEGSVDLTGGGTFNLTAPTSGDYEGLLLFTSRTNTEDIVITGGSASTFGGTIYSPAGILKLSGGSGSLSLDAQVIVNKLQISGSAGINVEYDSSLGYNPGEGSKYVEITD
ncbi:MAG: pilus assembly protein TadG-related protein [Anaerolineales bacterium]